METDLVRILEGPGFDIEELMKVCVFTGLMFGWVLGGSWGPATPLHSAAQNSDSPSVIAALLDAGADIEARGLRGMTPLHMAAHWGAPAVVAALLDAGADPMALDDRAWTPWDWACGRSDLDGTEAYRRLRDACTR